MGCFNTVKLLLDDPRVDPSVQNNYLFQLASKTGQIEIVKLLLKNPRVDPSANKNMSIKIASKKGHFDIVKLLLEDPRVDPHQQSSEFGQIDVVTLLLKNQANPSTHNSTAQNNLFEDLVELFLQYSNLKNNENYTTNMFLGRQFDLSSKDEKIIALTLFPRCYGEIFCSNFGGRYIIYPRKSTC